MNAPADIQMHQTIAIEDLVASPTNPRKTFDQAKLAELSENVLLHGIVQPLLVRPNPKRVHGYEIVFGERRYRAAKLAKLTHVPCIVRDLADVAVLELQCIENLQREDLHPLEEAEGYEQLMKGYGYDAAQIAAKVGKSPTYIYGRMKLLALSPKARKWFRDGVLTASVALLVARIPVPSLQDKALEDLVDRSGDPLGASHAASYIRSKYMLDLSRAPFETGSTTLVPAAGACGPCPKRSGNQPELFGDVSNKDTCTDPTCWAGKKKAHQDKIRAEAEARGQTVITGKAARKIKPNEYTPPQGFIELDEKCYDEGGRGRTYREILGKAAPTPTLVESPTTETLIEMVPRDAVVATLREKGVGTRPANDEQKQREAKAKLENATRWAIFEAVHQVPIALGQAELALIAKGYLADIWDEHRKRIAKLWGWDKGKIDDAIEALDVDQLGRLLLDLALVKETHVGSWSVTKSHPNLSAVAERAGVDHAKIRRTIAAEARAKAKKKAPAKKAAATVVAKKGAVTIVRPAKQKRPGGNRKKKGEADLAAAAEAPVVKVETRVATRDEWPFPVKGATHA